LACTGCPASVHMPNRCPFFAQELLTQQDYSMKHTYKKMLIQTEFLKNGWLRLIKFLFYLWTKIQHRFPVFETQSSYLFKCKYLVFTIQSQEITKDSNV
jgi:hypothetical protein